MKPLSAFKRPNLFFRIFLVLLLTFINLTSIDLPKANAAVPGAPTITAITRGSNQLSVAFTAPSGVSPAITNYEYSTDGGSTWTSASPAVTTSPLTISGLIDCQVYSISIRAVNSDGSGTASEAWNGVPGNLKYALNNGLMKFGSTNLSTGDGDTESILTSGNLKQPWYKNGSGGWSKLTFSSNALNYGLGVGGDGTNAWNANGTVQEVTANLSRMTIDCSQFVERSRTGDISVGYGTLVVNGQTTIGGQTVEITRTYTQTSDSKYTIFKESIKNVSASNLTNARLWVGTRDDWIGNNDSNTKRRGNIVNGAFSKITSAGNQAKVLEVTNGSDTVYFYTTSNLGYITGLDGYGDFKTRVMTKDPALASIEVTNDGSYGMYLRFQDIAPNASESFTWYYIASTSAQAQALLGNVASAALPGAPTLNTVTEGNSQLSVDFSEGTAGGSAITNYQFSIDNGSTWRTRSPASTTSPLVITGLANGTSYNVKIRAINSEGAGSASNTVSGTPVGPPQAPLITALNQTSNSVAVQFDRPADGGAAISNFQYSLDAGLTWSTPSPAVTTSPLTISGLSAGTDYQIALRAINSVGTGTASSVQDVTTFTTPSSPSISAVNAGAGSLSVDFNLGSSGGTPITNLEYSIDGGASWVTRSPASTYSPLLITGLTNGTSYSVAIRAVNTVGHSSSSNSISGTPVTVPSAISLPSNTNVTASNQSLTLTFDAPSNGGSAITTYQYSTDRGTTWRTRTDGGGTNTSSLLITTLSSDGSTSLTNGTEYCVQVRALNAIGSGQASNDVCSTPKTVPDAPTISSTTSSDRAIDVAFDLSGNGGSAITDVEYCLANCQTSSNWNSFGSITSPQRITGLTNGTAYTVSIRVKNSVGSSQSVTASSAVTPASNPSAPTITDVTTSSGSATLTFTAPSSNGGIAITNYEYSTDSGSTWSAVSPSSTNSPLTITSLTNGMSYGFSIRAKTASTTGLSSSVVFGTPSTTPSAPNSVTLTALSGRVTASFTAPNNGGSPITNYEYSTDGGSNWIPANVLTPSFTISNLTNGTAYTIKLRAVNLRGNGSVYTHGTTVTPTGVPDSPVISSTSNSRLTNTLTDRQISVNFTEPANNGSTITNYQYSTDGGTTWLNRTDSTGRFSPLVISKLSSDGTTDLSIDTEYSIKIRAVNGNGNGDGSSTVTARTGGAVDNVAPTVSIVSASGSDSASRTLTYNVTFSETVQGFERTDFTKASGTATCSIGSVSAFQGITFTVTVTCTTDGTFALRMNANTVTDGTNTGPTNAVTVSAVTIDTAAPTATVTSPGANSSSRTLTYTVAFSSTVSGISTSDFIKASGTANCSTSAVSASSGSSVNFTVTCSTDGTIVMKLLADSVTRSSFTGPVSPVESSSVSIDSSVPTATITTSTIDSTRTLIDFDVAFSEAVSGISLTDFVQSAGTASCLTSAVTSSSGTAVTFTVTCTRGGTLQMRLTANSVTDGVNTGPAVNLLSSTLSVGPTVSNSNSGSTVNSDQSIPTASVVSPSPISRSRGLSFTVNFSESVSDISASDFVQVSGSNSCTTTSVSQSRGTSATFGVICSNEGTVVMQLLANSVTDGTNSGPANSVNSREITVRTVAQPQNTN